jgi:dihydrofolate reductase
MARLIYSAIMSLDGYTADADGRIEWAAPDDEVHAFVNELERPVGTYLYGRRMYETMRYWETAHTLDGQSPASLDFARIWQAADKIVYSTTLQSADTAKTRIERDITRAYVRAFFDQHLRSRPQALLDQPSPRYPEVTFCFPEPGAQSDVV